MMTETKYDEGVKILRRYIKWWLSCKEERNTQQYIELQDMFNRMSVDDMTSIVDAIIEKMLLDDGNNT